MSHMVIYRTADGQPGYHQTEERDDAVQYVERLRNTEGVDHARIFHMEEVTFDYKPYYKVEVGNETVAISPAPAPAPARAPAPAAFTPAPVEERGWLDPPAAEHPLLANEPAAPEPVLIEPVMAETPLLAPEPVFAEVDDESEPLGLLDSIPPPPPPPAPAVDDESEGLASNGMGARRGLFGR